MSDLFASVGGHRATTLRLYVPNVGPWFLDSELDEAVKLAGPVEVVFGKLRLKGTIAPSSSGAFQLTARARVVGGGGGWGKVLAPKSYHNDAGVRAPTVAEDAAREGGETLGTFDPLGPGVLGNDYVRAAGPASRALEDAAGGRPWWVDYQGVTKVAARPSVALAPGKGQILSYDPGGRLAVVGVDDPGEIGIGSVLTDRLDSPATVRELEYTMTAGALRAVAWCGGDESSETRLIKSLSDIVERILARRLYGKYRYRVVSMAVDGRVNLQAVTKAAGLPDVVPAMMRPGVAGVFAELALGGEVLVEFIAGKASDPIVTGFAGKGEPGFVPTRLVLGAANAGSAPAAARQGDTVRVPFPPAIFSGTILVSGVPSPATGAITFTPNFGIGVIEGGSGRVGIGS